MIHSEKCDCLFGVNVDSGNKEMTPGTRCEIIDEVHRMIVLCSGNGAILPEQYAS